jgi:hypothetical protein
LRGEVRGGMLRCNGLTWKTNMSDGTALISLRPENIRLHMATFKSSGDEAVVFRGKVKQKAFHGATELLQVACADGLTLTVRIASQAELQDELEWEFQTCDAVPVRESPEKL